MASEGSRKYDLVIFGATGFTGQFVVEEVARTEEEEGKLTWAVAGRSLSKLENVLRDAGKRTGKDLDKIPIIIADVKSEASLQNLCKQTMILLNCVGPYQLYGDAVVRACIENKTHHIDISGEPLFLENTQLVYNGKAKEAGIYILQACGFDSVPSDMGVVYTKKEFKGDLNHIEGYLTLNFGDSGCSGNVGTWNSAILSYSNAEKIRSIRKQLTLEPLPKSNYKMPKRTLIFYSKETNGWCVPFIGADRSVVMRSERYNYEVRKERPVQFNVYTRLTSVFAIAYLMLLGLVFGLFSQFSLGRKLLEMFPKQLSFGLFDSNGPSREQIAKSSFTLDLVGYGYKDKLDDVSKQHEDKPTEKIFVKVTGPDIGYVTTPICMVQAAYTLLKEQNNLPKGGGVLTPGAAFAKTDLIERLDKHGIIFKTLDQ